AFYFVVSLTASTAVNHLRKRFRMA
ncbi:MAG TPA: amino acid ABC transporter permease, partial [Moraxellaceae bacterium]|nr:amino acid ABC transporter permease [Moraxellaceae bacterium]